VEINTLKEADLCNSSTITDRVFVTTVHKAKGLEFDNVVVFDAVDGRYPNFYSKNDPQALNEDARKFYVAMSRAKKRLFIAYSEAFVDYRGGVHPRQLTPFMKSIKKFFKKD
jgi:DNA helicase-2/ATP-dependent DNA helicase PcrA